MTRLLVALAFAAGPLLFAGPAPAQDFAPDPPSPPAPADPTEDPIPLDGGITLLAAAGAGYALHRLRKRGEDDEDAG